jgi:hypothetical protein
VTLGERTAWAAARPAEMVRMGQELGNRSWEIGLGLTLTRPEYD